MDFLEGVATGGTPAGADDGGSHADNCVDILFENARCEERREREEEPAVDVFTVSLTLEISRVFLKKRNKIAPPMKNKSRGSYNAVYANFPLSRGQTIIYSFILEEGFLSTTHWNFFQ